ncbi:hypothetical protein SB725_26235 [Pseudomonas sp. SIMBA_041]|uniref:hypothetical protein n=1 Tax=Pseudomonas sp. SIMBA_041 TaxID=3085782 RepID=UPI00397C20FA
MSQSTFAVYLPDRYTPVCIEADSFVHYGGELVLHKDEQMVGRSSDRGFLVRSDLVREHTLSDDLMPGQPEGLVASAETIDFQYKPATVWPFTAGLAFGLLVGIGTSVALLGRL